MEEKTIVKISLAITILGLGFLFLYAEQFDAQKLEELQSIPSDEYIQMKGKVTRMKTTDNAVFLEIEGEKIIKTEVILFSGENLFLKEGDYVEVEGMVEDYNHQKEVIASKVVLK